jgi:tRNA(Ile)-lysidine synthase
MDMDRLQEGLHVRAWRPGDRFRPLGARGSKKLQDLFTDVKWPRMDRRRVPIVADAEGIVWVVGLRLGDRAKITSDTRRVLTLRFERP